MPEGVTLDTANAVAVNVAGNGAISGVFQQSQ